MISSFKTSIALTLLALFLAVPSAHATPINWQFEGTLQLTSGADTLGVDGEMLQIDLMFDTTQTWGSTGIGSILSVQPITATAQITGGHTAALDPTLLDLYNFNTTSGPKSGLANITGGALNPVGLTIDASGVFLTGFEGTAASLAALNSNLSSSELVNNLPTDTIQVCDVPNCNGS